MENAPQLWQVPFGSERTWITEVNRWPRFRYQVQILSGWLISKNLGRQSLQYPSLSWLVEYFQLFSALSLFRRHPLVIIYTFSGMSLTTPCEKHVDESCSLRKRSKTWKADHDFSEVLQTEHQDKGRTNLYMKSWNISTCCITFIYQYGKTHLSSNFLLPLTEIRSYIFGNSPIPSSLLTRLRAFQMPTRVGTFNASKDSAPPLKLKSLKRSCFVRLLGTPIQQQRTHGIPGVISSYHPLNDALISGNPSKLPLIPLTKLGRF